ncbi:hypothetical protein PMIT1320_00125 [Prochlorococcus marinus str. MIT 1320]|nr:hypothetical protein PMIT1320_00125 [Prochlorococcus marinus str. MIT 1320]
MLAIFSKEYLHLMTDPKENEEINEELSTDELKSVSGGAKIHGKQIGIPSPSLTVNIPDSSGVLERGDGDFRNSKASGSGMTKVDFERVNKRHGVVGSTDGASDHRMGNGLS